MKNDKVSLLDDNIIETLRKKLVIAKNLTVAIKTMKTEK